MRLGVVVRVLRACPCHSTALGSHPAMTVMSCSSGALVVSYTTPGSFRDIRVTNAAVASSVGGQLGAQHGGGGSCAMCLVG